MTLKKLSIYFGALITFVFILSICYYVSYQSALRDYNTKSTQQSNTLVSYLKELTKTDAIQNNDDNSTAVDTSDELRVLPSTRYRLQTYDTITNQLVEEELTIPSKLIGLTRQEVINLLADEIENISIDEYQKGLVSSVLASFSENEIVVRKSYNKDLVQYKYYLAISAGKVIVYYSDRKTVYEYTGIDATNLSERSQAELSLGKYAKDEAELYSILEGYSS